MPLRKMRKRAVIITALFLSAAALYTAKIMTTNNFHEVVSGEVYRSAQVDEEEINYYKKKYNIQSIISLRKAAPGTEWYDDELAESKKLGITYIGFPMDSGEELTDVETVDLIEKMRNAPKPMLIHCEHGANRTGLAAALYMADIKKVKADVADDQLSLKYGHINLGIFDTEAMGDSFRKYADKTP